LLTNSRKKVSFNLASASLHAEEQLHPGLAASEGWGAFISAAKEIMDKGIMLFEDPVKELIPGVGYRFAH